MSDGRVSVFPQAIGFGSRPLAVPGRGAMLCASALFPFRLSTAEPIAPADWYQAVSASGGKQVAPDSMAPVPGAELLVLGSVAPVPEDGREATLRCGALERHLLLRADPERPGAPLAVGPEAAAWHEEDNPGGRGSPGDGGREPLIVGAGDPEAPVWLGPTPFDHPMRVRLAGVPDEQSGAGWPVGADPAVLCESHAAFWTDRLDPGDPLTLAGIAERDLDTCLPPYRVTVTSGRAEGRWVLETARIHCVSLIPLADLGAVIWRVEIPLADDILGESVAVLIAALEDVDSPMKDEWHWADIFAERLDDAVQAMDDRPLLPAALAAAVAAPFALPDDDVIEERRAAAESWMRDEADLDENPFGAPPAQAGIVDEASELVDVEDEPPDTNAVGALAETALAAGRQRHEEAGFETPEVDPEAPREPERRGEALDAEIGKRLSRPYASPQEIALATHMRAAGEGALDPEETLAKLADARKMNSNPPLHWPALDETEGPRFGNRIVDCLAERELERHIDVSGAIVDSSDIESDDAETAASRPESSPVSGLATAALERHRISGRRLEGLLAEDTTWRGVEFANCEIADATFAGARFENCVFDGCVFDETNLSRTHVEGCEFTDCVFSDLRIIDPVWMNCRFDRCRLERIAMSDAAVRDLAFTGGTWEELQWVDCLMVGVAMRGAEMRQVTYSGTHAPHSRFERVSMFKVWGLHKGFPGSVFEEVDARTCGFIANFHFDESRFERTRFEETGFTNAVFKDVKMSPDCRFENCELGGAIFEGAELAGARFVQCNMTTSVWSGVNAADAWFFGALLRGVDFGDTDLARAVFTDADLEGTQFLPDKTIGADFRGTVRENSG